MVADTHAGHEMRLGSLCLKVSKLGKLENQLTSLEPELVRLRQLEPELVRLRQDMYAHAAWDGAGGYTG